MGIERIVEDLQKEKDELKQKLEAATAVGMHLGQKYWFIPWIIIGFFGGCSILWGILQ